MANNPKTRVTGAKTKRKHSRRATRASRDYATRQLDKSYPGGVSGLRTDMERGDYPDRVDNAIRDAKINSLVHRATNYMKSIQPTELETKKPSKKLKTPQAGRDIPLPKSKF